MKLLYLHVRDSGSLYKDTCIHFDPEWRFEEKGKEVCCSRSEVDVVEFRLGMRAGSGPSR